MLREQAINLRQRLGDRGVGSRQGTPMLLGGIGARQHATGADYAATRVGDMALVHQAIAVGAVLGYDAARLAPALADIAKGEIEPARPFLEGAKAI